MAGTHKFSNPAVLIGLAWAPRVSPGRSLNSGCVIQVQATFSTILVISSLAERLYLRRLRKNWDCLEVFPQAIVAVLKAREIHKGCRDSLMTQLAAVALQTRWPVPLKSKAYRMWASAAFTIRHMQVAKSLINWYEDVNLTT